MVVLQRNGTTWSDGDLRMHTGQGDMERLGQIVSWNQNNQTEAFQGKRGRETHVGREIVNEPWSIGNFSSSIQRDGSPNWQPVFFSFLLQLGPNLEKASQSQPSLLKVVQNLKVLLTNQLLA